MYILDPITWPLAERALQDSLVEGDPVVFLPGLQGTDKPGASSFGQKFSEDRLL